MAFLALHLETTIGKKESIRDHRHSPAHQSPNLSIFNILSPHDNGLPFLREPAKRQTSETQRANQDPRAEAWHRGGVPDTTRGRCPVLLALLAAGAISCARWGRPCLLSRSSPHFLPIPNPHKPRDTSSSQLSLSWLLLCSVLCCGNSGWE